MSHIHGSVAEGILWIVPSGTRTVRVFTNWNIINCFGRRNKPNKLCLENDIVCSYSSFIKTSHMAISNFKGEARSSFLWAHKDETQKYLLKSMNDNFILHINWIWQFGNFAIYFKYLILKIWWPNKNFMGYSLTLC